MEANRELLNPQKLKALLSFKGRITKKEWVITMAVTVVVPWLVANYLALNFTMDETASLEDLMPSARDILGALAAFLLSSLLGWIYTASTVKRFHDIGKSGWNLCWAAIPVLGWIFILSLLLLAEESPGDNMYGPSPQNIP